MKIDLDFLTSGNEVANSHFGANYLPNRQAFGQSIEGKSLYKVATEELSIHGMRYPGGTITEKFFDITDKRHWQHDFTDSIVVTNHFDSSETTTFTPLGNFLKFASSVGERVTIVVPTIKYFDHLNSNNTYDVMKVEKELKEFVKNALSSTYGHAIESFEIGNEYPSWIAGHNIPILRDSVDFAMITRNFSVWIQEAIDELAIKTQPDIIAQAAFVMYGSRGNKVLLEGMFDDNKMASFLHVESLEKAYAAIDGVSVHSYPLTPWTKDSSGEESLQRDIDLLARWQSTFDDYAVGNSLNKKHLGGLVTEWNVRNSSIKSGEVSGIQAATGFIASFNYLVRNGVDVMHVWPVLQQSTNSLMMTKGEELSVNFNGAAFSILKATVMGHHAHEGVTHYDLNGDRTPDIMVQLYTSDHSSVLIVASLTDANLEFDLGLPGKDFYLPTSFSTSFSLQSSMEDAKDKDGIPVVVPNFETRYADGNRLTAQYSLDPWEINFTVMSDTVWNPYFFNSLQNHIMPSQKDWELRGNDILSAMAGSEMISSFGVDDTNDPAGTVYRFFNSKTGAHFYTANVVEREIVRLSIPDLHYEGAAFQAQGDIEVYRFFNSKTGAHFYTVSIEERDQVIKTLPNFQFEGVSFSASETEGTNLAPLHRFYNAQSGAHFYTANGEEQEHIAENLPVFTYEGVSLWVGIA